MTEFMYDNIADRTLSAETRKALTTRIQADIEAYCIKEYTDEHRTHLGASILGQDCSRAIWYGWRWVKFEVFDGRMLRLFERGKNEEEKFIKLLRGIGFQIWEVDPNTGKQFRIWGCNGHYGGSADSVGIMPYLPDLPLLLEFKSYNLKRFDKLFNKGVILADPQYFDQMCQYGRHYNFKYALFCAVCKNDDELYFEVVELDWKRSHELQNQADDIIKAKLPPAKIATQPSYYKCKMCVFNDVCWSNAPIQKNCRSCQHASAVDDAQWFCSRYGQNIPQEYIKQGCDGWTPIV